MSNSSILDNKASNLIMDTTPITIVPNINTIKRNLIKIKV